MDSNHTKDQEAERLAARRKRINRMKAEIVLFIFGWILISMVAIIVLTVFTVSQNRQLKRMEEKLEAPVSYVSQETESVSESESEPVPTEEDYSNVVFGIDFEENMAGEKDAHKVYLTFDGSPGSSTEAILDKLAEYDVKAAFFVIGTEDETYYPVYRRIAAEGHTLGMHSYSNRYSQVYASQEAFEEDYRKLRSLLSKVTSQKSVYYRFPGGSGTEIGNVDMVKLVRFLNSENVVYYDWNVSAGDTVSDVTPEQIVSNVTEGVAKYKTSVVLLHDTPNKSTTADALGPLIEALRQMGAEILPIDENTQVIQYIHSDSVK